MNGVEFSFWCDMFNENTWRPESVKGHKARGVYWTKPDKSGKEVVRDVNINESAYSEFI